MKATRKISLFVGLAAFGLIASGAGVTFAAYSTSKKDIDQTISLKRTIYLDINNSSSWQANNAKFSAYIWGHATKPACFVGDAFMETVTTNVYRVAIPSGYSYILFVRHPSSCTSPSFNSNSIWNQTKDLAIPTSNESKDSFQVNNNAITSQDGDNGKFNGTWVERSQYTYTTA